MNREGPIDRGVCFRESAQATISHGLFRETDWISRIELGGLPVPGERFVPFALPPFHVAGKFQRHRAIDSTLNRFIEGFQRAFVVAQATITVKPEREPR